MKNYFITGATGAIGAALVPILLEDKDINLTLLIRAENHQHLKERMNFLYDFWQIGEDDIVKNKIHAVIGDMKKPRFGMDETEYQSLINDCSHIIHSAGNVRMNLPISEARACSVDSAKNVIELAMSCKKKENLKKIEIVSTVGVGGKMRDPVPETWLTQPRQFHNTYEQAKAEAEEYVREFVDKGFPITIHRPSMVVGDSQTGRIIHFQIFYHLCEFLSGNRTFGIVPFTGSATLDTIPSDYVAKLIAWSSRTQKTSGMVLHECSGENSAISIKELQKLSEKILGGKGKCIIIPVWMFKGLLPFIRWFVPGKTKRAMNALPIFFEYLIQNQVFENKETLSKAEKIVFPHTESYLEKVVVTYRQEKRTT